MKFKKLNDEARLPSQAYPGDAGYDIFAISEKFIQSPTGPLWEYETGLACEIPDGYVGLLFPRSSVTSKTTFMLGNSVGVIDSKYRGPIKFQFRDVKPPGSLSKRFELDNAIGQLVIVPYYSSKPEFVDNLSETKRGLNGFGSSDTKTKS